MIAFLANRFTILPHFKTSPSILFEMLGQPANLAENYSFDSVEIKQVGFRIDGVLLPKPDSIDQTVIFLEVQVRFVCSGADSSLRWLGIARKEHQEKAERDCLG